MINKLFLVTSLLMLTLLPKVKSQDLKNYFLKNRKANVINYTIDAKVQLESFSGEYSQIRIGDYDALTMDQSSPESVLLFALTLNDDRFNQLTLDQQRPFSDFTTNTRMYDDELAKKGLEDWYISFDYKLSYDWRYKRAYIRTTAYKEGTNRCRNWTFRFIEKDGKWWIETNGMDIKKELYGPHLWYFDYEAINRIFHGDHRNEDAYIQLFDILLSDKESNTLRLDKIQKFFPHPYWGEFNSCYRLKKGID